MIEAIEQILNITMVEIDLNINHDGTFKYTYSDGKTLDECMTIKGPTIIKVTLKSKDYKIIDSSVFTINSVDNLQGFSSRFSDNCAFITDDHRADSYDIDYGFNIKVLHKTGLAPINCDPQIRNERTKT